MYGSEKTDLVVKYYDVAFGISGEAEVEWYLNKARAFGGPVLDLACGTGRLALLLAKEGFEVTGIDQSTGMLNLFREKLEAQPPEVKDRVRVENQRMSSFKVGAKYGTIICCDAFFHNATVQEEMDCLFCVANHLAPDGRFVFNYLANSVSSSPAVALGSRPRPRSCAAATRSGGSSAAAEAICRPATSSKKHELATYR
jgi:2-polyprenyl-3-methyl-5-hydroxy-6-metoxy-1,4-benzoquinol methylase